MLSEGRTGRSRIAFPANSVWTGVALKNPLSQRLVSAGLRSSVNGKPRARRDLCAPRGYLLAPTGGLPGRDSVQVTRHVDRTHYSAARQMRIGNRHSHRRPPLPLNDQICYSFCQFI